LGYLPRRVATVRVAGVEGGEPSVSFVGGGLGRKTWGPIGATWPLVRLEVRDWGIRVGPNYAWIAWLLPTSEFRWADISDARRMHWGIRIRARSSPKGSIAFNSNVVGTRGTVADQLVAEFRAHGVEVE
jgi:hypothetical protein